MASHSFDTGIAKECGIAAAVVLNNIYYWCKFNEHQGKNYFEGRYWTYNTHAGLSAIMDYLSVDQIRYALEKLKDAGYVLVGNFNKGKRDRTIWYTVSGLGLVRLGCMPKEVYQKSLSAEQPDCENSQAMRENSQMAQSGKFPNVELGNFPNDTCGKIPTALPDINTYINPDNNNPPIIPPTTLDAEEEQADAEKGKVSKKKWVKRERDTKEYAEFVSLTEKEYQRLVEEFGENAADKLIDILNNYKGSKGAKYKNDYLAIRSWVVNRWQEEQERTAVKSCGGLPKNYTPTQSDKNLADFIDSLPNMI